MQIQIRIFTLMRIQIHIKVVVVLVCNILAQGPSTAPGLILHSSIESEPKQLPAFYFDLDPDTAFHLDADPDATSQNDAESMQIWIPNQCSGSVIRMRIRICGSAPCDKRIQMRIQLRIQMRIRLRILLFSSMTFKMPTKK
jgi:hypothetical protein